MAKIQRIPLEHITAKMEDRFWSKVDGRQDPTGCWLRQRATRNVGWNLPDGKASFQAHRVAYALTHGNMDPGTILLISCGVGNCVNPAHMELVESRGKFLASLPKTLMTHCDEGHAMTDENLVPSNLKQGNRTCRVCHRAKSLARYHANKAKVEAKATAKELHRAKALAYYHANKDKAN